MAFLGLNTISQPGASSPRCLRMASRMTRLARFRFTAFPRARGAVMPTREGCSAGRRRQNAVNEGKLRRTPPL